MSEQVVVGVDIGSSSTRAAAVRRDGAVVADSTVRYPADDLPAGEADPATWLRGAVAAIVALDVEPVAVCFGGQGPTTVAASGERALTFRHPAGASQMGPEQHAAQFDVLRETYGAEVQPRQLWDWVAARLGAPSDVQSLWPNSAPLAEFGDPIPVGSSLGTSDGRHGLAAGITIAAGANDAYLTAWGSGIDVPGKGFDPGGTTGGLGVAVRAEDHPVAASYGMASAVEGVSIIGGPVAAHGAMLEWWSEMSGRDIPSLLDAAAKAPPGSDGVMVLPFFEGERAPRWNLALRAEIVGLHLDHDIGIVTRALVEATAYGLAHIARDLRAQGVILDRLVCSGGPSQNHFWSAVKAAVLEVPVDVTSYPEMAAYGAALAAGAAAGWWPRPGEGEAEDWPAPDVTTIEPEPHDVYREGLVRFIELGDAAEERLNKMAHNDKENS
jgi:xylulokinase